MRKRAFQPTFESLGLRITPSSITPTTVDTLNAASLVDDNDPPGVLTGMPGSMYFPDDSDDGGNDQDSTDEPRGVLTGMPGSMYF